jgi:hypothetical protein
MLAGASASDLLDWLLDEDAPAVRALALRDLLGQPAGDSCLEAASHAAHHEGPIASILAAMHADGYWVQPGPGYAPKYRGTVWSLIALAQMGAGVAYDPRIARACAYILDHALTPYGQFSGSGTPGGTVHCLQGNLCTALLDLGYDDVRLEGAYEWMARSVTGEGVAPMGSDTPLRYYSGTCAAGFACGANNRLPCAWGATKVMLAFSRWPPARHTPLVTQAIAAGTKFLLKDDPVEAAYPCGWAGKPSHNWWRFGFPVFYVTDLLQIAEALVALGLGGDPRLANLLALIRSKADTQGRWPTEYDYSGKTWVTLGGKNRISKWVTLRALRVLRAASQSVELQGR